MPWPCSSSGTAGLAQNGPTVAIETFLVAGETKVNIVSNVTNWYLGKLLGKVGYFFESFIGAGPACAF
jgi:hypothetical protein